MSSDSIRRNSASLSRYSLIGVVCLCLCPAVLFAPFASESLSWRALIPFRGGPRPIGMAKRMVGYFPNWGIYGRKTRPQDIDTTGMTHILYAFANVDGETGQVILSDKWADEEIHWEGDSWNDQGSNLYGCMKQFAIIKRKQRNLKLLLSIGGWTYAHDQKCFRKAGTESKARKRFVESCLTLLDDYPLDGIDLDWEYPETKTEAQGYVDLLRDLRDSLDKKARKAGDAPFELTIAAPCGEQQRQRLMVKEMDRYLTFWNLMAYDFSGSWSDKASHQANFFDRGEPNAISVDRAIRYYTSQGVPANKLVIGMPLYGRSFANTAGLGHSFSGVGEGTWEPGSIDYKQLPRPGANVQFDRQLLASWTYDTSRREFVTFDSNEAAEAKADQIAKMGLGGVMVWELSADFPRGHPKALVPRVARRLGQLDRSLNHLAYPKSKFGNLRSGAI